MEILGYVIIAALLLVSELIYFKIADKFNITDKPNLRSSHKSITLRGGGVVFYFGALAAFFYSGFEYPWFILGLTLITVVSFIDDVYSTSNKIRLLVHFISMLLMFYQIGLFLNLPTYYILLALVFCIGIINAYNFMDGINGITGGYSIVVLVPLILLNYSLEFINQHFLYISLISVLVFCFFNFRKKAKCFAGDVGSVSIAFILLFALGALIFKTGNLSYLVLLAVYGVDSILTIIHRLILKENIFVAHRKHMYQIMANELKVPHVVVSLIYMGMQLLISLGYIYIANSYTLSLLYLSITALVLSILYLIFIKKNFFLYKD